MISISWSSWRIDLRNFERGNMNSILITGCNRGLGLGLVKALVKLPKPPQHLFATCRNKEQAKVRPMKNKYAAATHLHPFWFYVFLRKCVYRNGEWWDDSVWLSQTREASFLKVYYLLIGAILKRFTSSTAIQIPLTTISTDNSLKYKNIFAFLAIKYSQITQFFT